MLARLKIVALFTGAIVVIIDLAITHGNTRDGLTWVLFALGGGLVYWSSSG